MPPSPKSAIKYVVAQLRLLMFDQHSGRSLKSQLTYWQLTKAGLRNTLAACLVPVHAFSDFVHSRRWLSGTVALSVTLLCAVLLLKPEEKIVKVLEPPLNEQAIAQHNQRHRSPNFDNPPILTTHENLQPSGAPDPFTSSRSQSATAGPFFAPSLMNDDMKDRRHSTSSPFLAAGDSTSNGAWLTGNIEEVDETTPVGRTGFLSSPHNTSRN